MSLMPPIIPGQFVKPSIPVGAGFDILNGTYYTGQYGEQILSGGLSYITGFVAKGNAFKSTLVEWMIATAMARVSPYSEGIFYDTEMNKKEQRMASLQLNIRDIYNQAMHMFGMERSLFDQGRYTLTDKAVYSGNKFFDAIKEGLAAKQKDKKNVQLTPFLDRDGKSPFKMLVPTFTAYDSLTEFDTDDIDEIRDKSELGGSKQNVINFRAGLVKTNLMTELPRISVQANNYTMLVAQIGKNLDIGASPHAPPRQQLKSLPASEAIKGATGKFTFATHDCWWCESASPYLNDSDKKSEFPWDASTTSDNNTDLQKIKLKQLRGKGGPSYITHEVLVSQERGIQPTLTEFYHLRDAKRYGIESSGSGGAFMELHLYPEGKVTRQTVRKKIDEDPLFCRAVNFTMEMMQMYDFWQWVVDDGVYMTPQQVYDNLTARGYDWKVLLDTRGWWIVGDQDAHPQPYLSTMDLWNICAGKYHPYWYDKKVGKEAAAKIIKGPLVLPEAA